MISGLGAAPCPPAGAADEAHSPWRRYLYWVSVATAAGVVFSQAERLQALLMLYFEATERGDKQIYRLSLTMPVWEPSPARIRRAAQSLADAIAAEEGGGAWLAIDVTAEGREHLYGLAISSQAPDTLSKLWVALSGASGDGCKVRPVTGQKHGWDGARKAPSRLDENLARVIHYGLKSLPPRYDMTARERVITAGCLSELWERACTDFSPLPAEPKPPVAESGNKAEGLRCCQLCGGRVRAKIRRHARWCSPSCRTMAYEERRQLRAMLTAEERDAFEERAAICEFEAGLKRPQAEQRAFDELRRPAAALSAQLPSLASAYSGLV